MRAVIFDLWDTLVEWPVAEARRLRERIAALVGVGEEEFGRRWRESYRPSQTGPLADAYRALGVPSEHVEARGRRAARVRAPGAPPAARHGRRRSRAPRAAA